jgi:transcriptional regulator with XRE-family HTH domain
LAATKAHIGKAIRFARRSASLSQAELADAVGVHRPTVSAWEREENSPTRANVEDVARALAMTVESLELLSEEIAMGKVRPPASPSRRGAPVANDKARPRIPPRAYQLVYEYCSILESAEVPEETIEEARRLMSGETFNTLRKHMADERTEDGWVKDVKAAWAFIKDSLKAQGFDL